MRYEDMAAFKLQPEEPVSTDYRGYRVYKPGFWSQGPAMIETLNILEGFDMRSLGYNSAEYIHTSVEALKLAYADRDTYYGDPKFNPNCRWTSAFQELRRRAPQADRPDGLARFHARQDQRQNGQASGRDGYRAHQNRRRLMANDTTCVDAIDKDGIVFSATPSGAWLPSVIAGDTGIPLTERAQQFSWCPDPQRTGGRQTAARDAEPDYRHHRAASHFWRSRLPAATIRNRLSCS